MEDFSLWWPPGKVQLTLQREGVPAGWGRALSCAPSLPPPRPHDGDSTCATCPLEKEMATHSSILVWRIPWTEEPGGQRNQSVGLQKVRHN